MAGQKVKIGIAGWKLIVVGDSILLGPIFNFYKDLYGNDGFEITLFTPRRNKYITELLLSKYIKDGILKIEYNDTDKKKLARFTSLFNLIKQIRGCKFDYFFNTRPNSELWALITFFAKAKIKSVITNSFPFNGFFKRIFIKPDAVSQKTACLKTHRMQKTIDDLNKIHGSNITLRPIEIEDGKFNPHQFAKPTIGFYIAASHAHKSIHPRLWARLLKYIKQKYQDSFDIAIFGFGELYNTRLAAFKQEVLNLGLGEGDYRPYNNNPLEQDISYCGGLSLAVTNDSGFMHVASVFKIPTLSFFGFSPADKFMTQLGNEDKFFTSQSHLACSPCMAVHKCKLMGQEYGDEMPLCMEHERPDIYAKLDAALELSLSKTEAGDEKIKELFNTTSTKRQVEIIAECSVDLDRQINHNLLFKIAKRLDSEKICFNAPQNINKKLLNIDLCGTGGDGKNTLNVSTAAGLLLAKMAKFNVFKHGGRAVSSASGSADVMELLKNDGDVNIPQNFYFLNAAEHHPALANLREARLQFGKKSIFNLLGPMLNPFNELSLQVIGTFSSDVIGYAKALQLLKPNLTFAIVNSLDGMDELSIFHLNRLAINNINGDVLYFEVFYKGNLQNTQPQSLGGGDVNFNYAELKKLVLGDKANITYAKTVCFNMALCIFLQSLQNTDIKSLTSQKISSDLTVICDDIFASI